jgi:hypothetical protein
LPRQFLHLGKRAGGVQLHVSLPRPAVTSAAQIVRAQYLLRRHFENEFQLDRRAERQAGNSVHQAAGVLVFSEDVLQQLGRTVSNFGLVAEISRSCHHNAQPDDARHSIERSQMLARDSEAVERSQVSRLASSFGI